MVSRQKIELVFFFALFAAVAALTASLFVPFFTVLALAAIFAVILQPLYRATLRLLRNKAGLASLATILMGLVFVAVPVTFIGGQVFKFTGFVSEEGSFTAEKKTDDHIAILTYWRSFEQHEASHADHIFKAKFDAVGEFCTDTYEIGYEMLWQGEPEAEVKPKTGKKTTKVKKSKSGKKAKSRRR